MVANQRVILDLVMDEVHEKNIFYDSTKFLDRVKRKLLQMVRIFSKSVIDPIMSALISPDP